MLNLIGRVVHHDNERGRGGRRSPNDPVSENLCTARGCSPGAKEPAANVTGHHHRVAATKLWRLLGALNQATGTV